MSLVCKENARHTLRLKSVFNLFNMSSVRIRYTHTNQCSIKSNYTAIVIWFFSCIGIEKIFARYLAVTER